MGSSRAILTGNPNCNKEVVLESRGKQLSVFSTHLVYWLVVIRCFSAQECTEFHPCVCITYC